MGISKIKLPGMSAALDITPDWSKVKNKPDAEVITNKVTSLSSTSTDTEYPSAKCVYDIVGDIETILASI